MRLVTTTIRAPEDPSGTYRARIAIVDDSGDELALTGDPEENGEAIARASRVQGLMLSILKELGYISDEQITEQGQGSN